MVSKCRGLNPGTSADAAKHQLVGLREAEGSGRQIYFYSSSGGVSLQILFEEGIATRRVAPGVWEGSYSEMQLAADGSAKKYFRQTGPDLLVAGLRCFVNRHAGAEVDLPEEVVRMMQQSQVRQQGYKICSHGTGTLGEGWYALLPGETEFYDNADAVEADPTLTHQQNYLGFFSREEDLLDDLAPLTGVAQVQEQRPVERG